MTMPNGNQKHLHIKIKLLSPSKILSLSYGEVKNHFTLNAITQLPEPGGLFDCKIFGPVEDYTCICGKIKRDKNKKGQTCPQCGVEITTSFVRRRRMGHITLAAPVVHVWYHGIIAALVSIPRR